MVLTPDDVESQEFGTAWRGYDRQEVDRFLDLVAAALAQVARERDEARRRAEEVERDASDTLRAERLIKRALVEAQRTADETVAEARRAAEEMVSDARREAERQLDHARAQAVGVRQAVEELHRFRSEYGERVRAVMQRIGELPPLPQAIDQLSDRARSSAPPPAPQPLATGEQGREGRASLAPGPQAARPQPTRPQSGPPRSAPAQSGPPQSGPPQSGPAQSGPAPPDRDDDEAGPPAPPWM